MVCLKRVSCHAKLQEEQRKQLKIDTLGLREATKWKETMLHQCLNAFNNDHTYANHPSTKLDLLNLQCQCKSIPFQPAVDKLTMRSVEVLSQNENNEEVNYYSSIPAEMDKTVVLNF